MRFVFALSYIAAGRLSGTIERHSFGLFVIFAFFVV